MAPGLWYFIMGALEHEDRIHEQGKMSLRTFPSLIVG